MATSSSVTLEDLEQLDTLPPTEVMLEDHLSYPAPTSLPVLQRPEPIEQPKRLLRDRLYIGNLHPSVDEYALLHIFSKFGKVTKLDFLFHKSGPLKGKPRGYAFVEYNKDEEAQKALATAHDKLLRGKKITVTYAQQAPLDQYGNSFSSSGTKHRKGAMDVGRPTTISILKTGLNSRQEPKTAHKIALMEAKLRELEADKAPAETRPSTLPHHESLPLKPPTQSSAAVAASSSVTSSQHRKANKPAVPLPSLPFLPGKTGLPNPVKPSSSAPKIVRETRSKLAGVVIKPRSRPKE